MLRAVRLVDVRECAAEIRVNLLDILCGVWVIEGRPGLWSYNRGATRDTLIDTELQVSAEIVRARSSVTAVFDREVGLERVLRGALGVD